MASRMIHYVLGKQIAKDLNIKDVNAFCMGCMIADSFKIKNENPKSVSHFIDLVEGGRIINYHRFQESYLKEELDDFCLGYFLHLYMDAINWQKVIFEKVYPYQGFSREKNVELFYEDNHRFNTYLKNQLQLENDLKSINEYKVKEIDLDDQEAFLTLLNEDFNDLEDENYIIFTKEMFFDYMKECYEKGLENLKLVINFKTCDDPMQYIVKDEWMK